MFKLAVNNDINKEKYNFDFKTLLNGGKYTDCLHFVLYDHFKMFTFSLENIIKYNILTIE